MKKKKNFKFENFSKMADKAVKILFLGTILRVIRLYFSNLSPKTRKKGLEYYPLSIRIDLSMFKCLIDVQNYILGLKLVINMVIPIDLFLCNMRM